MRTIAPVLSVLLATSMSTGLFAQQWQHYGGDAYYEMRPGLTGTWQVSDDRSNSEFAVRVAYDNSYEKNISLKQDVSLMLQTVGVVLRGSGN